MKVTLALAMILSMTSSFAFDLGIAKGYDRDPTYESVGASFSEEAVKLVIDFEERIANGGAPQNSELARYRKHQAQAEADREVAHLENQLIRILSGRGVDSRGNCDHLVKVNHLHFDMGLEKKGPILECAKKQLQEIEKFFSKNRAKQGTPVNFSIRGSDASSVSRNIKVTHTYGGSFRDTAGKWYDDGFTVNCDRSPSGSVLDYLFGYNEGDRTWEASKFMMQAWAFDLKLVFNYQPEAEKACLVIKSSEIEEAIKLALRDAKEMEKENRNSRKNRRERPGSDFSGKFL